MAHRKWSVRKRPDSRASSPVTLHFALLCFVQVRVQGVRQMPRSSLERVALKLELWVPEEEAEA